MLRVADGLGVLHKTIGKTGLRLPYDYMVAVMPYLGLPIVFDSGLPGMLTDFIFGENVEGKQILAKLQSKQNIFNYRDFSEILPSPETIFLKNNVKPEIIEGPVRDAANSNPIFDLFNRQKVTNVSPESNHARWFARNLAEWHSRPAQTELFYVTFDIPNNVSYQMYTNLILNENDYDMDAVDTFWRIDNDNLMRKDFLGCYFLTAITLPQDALKVSMTEIPNGSKNLAPFLYTDGRDFSNLTALTTRFRETNVSIIDSLLRPWLIALSHLGLTADDYKCTITIHQMSKNGADSLQLKRKVWTYYNAFPISISQQELQKSGASDPFEYQVVWGYSHHTVRNYVPFFGRIAQKNSSFLENFI